MHNSSLVTTARTWIPLTIEKRGISPIMPMIDKINATKNLPELIALAGDLAKYDVGSPFMVYVSADDRNSKMNAIFMGQGGLSLGDRNYYDNKDSAMVKIREEFVKHVDKMFAMAGWKVNRSRKDHSWIRNQTGPHPAEKF